MGIYKEAGFNRLAKLIAIVAFFLTFATLLIILSGVNGDVAFIIIPIISLFGAAGAFIFTRLVYWVIDGFKKNDDKNE